MAERHGLQQLYIGEGAVAEYVSLLLRSRRIAMLNTNLRIVLCLYTDSSDTPRTRGRVSCPKRQLHNHFLQHRLLLLELQQGICNNRPGRFGPKKGGQSDNHKRMEKSLL